jgi:cell division protein ZapD
MNDFIIYEQPITENVRNFLKCEYLNEKFICALNQHDIWSIKSSISTLIEMSDFVFRTNIKIELLKDLEKNLLFLDILRERNTIELNIYDEFYTNIKSFINDLNNTDSNPSKTISDNDFLMQVKGKLHIPAGDNFFDMPSYLNFLSSKRDFIIDNINNWYLPFKKISLSSILLLDFKRTISKFEYFSTENSFFEMKLNKSGKTDLVRIKLKKNMNVFPDISVNSQNINIMFKTSYGKNIKSKPIDENLDFGLSLSCIK